MAAGPNPIRASSRARSSAYRRSDVDAEAAPAARSTPSSMRDQDDARRAARRCCSTRTTRSSSSTSRRALPCRAARASSRHVDEMLEAWRNQKGEKPRLVHRLDRDTSGVLVVARTRLAAMKLAEAFRARDTKKTYWALVKGVPRQARGQDLHLARQGADARRRPRADRQARRGGRRPRGLATTGWSSRRRRRWPGWRWSPIPAAPTSCASTPPISATRSSATRNISRPTRTGISRAACRTSCIFTRAASSSRIPTAASSTSPRRCRRICARAGTCSASTSERRRRRLSARRRVSTGGSAVDTVAAAAHGRPDLLLGAERRRRQALLFRLQTRSSSASCARSSAASWSGSGAATAASPCSSATARSAAGLLAGALFGGEFLLIFIGLEFTSVARSTLMVNTMPFWVLIGAHFLLGERMTRCQVRRSCAGFLRALALVFSDRLGVPGPPTCMGDLHVARRRACFWAATTLRHQVEQAAQRQRGEAAALPAWRLDAHVVAAALPAAGPASPRAVSASASRRCCSRAFTSSAITYILWFWLMRRYPAAGLSSFVFLTPVFGVLCGGFILGEPLTLRILPGAGADRRRPVHRQPAIRAPI